MPEVRRVAILDDYQNVARKCADWSTLPDGVELTVFDAPLRSDEVVDALAPFDVAVAMRERTPFPASTLQRLPALRLLVTTGPTNSAIDLDAAGAAGVTVAGTRPAGIPSTVELTWGLLLALARHIPAEDARVRAGGWQHTVGVDLAGRRLGLVGLGNAGGAVGRVATAFGMDVVAWSAHLDTEQAAAQGVRAVAKDKLFRTADIVSVHLVLSESTRRTVAARELGLMKDTALLVNTSRGPIVDERALLEALHRGALGGAAIDVYDTEPLPVTSPWRTAPRTVLTPHLGYVSENTYEVFYGDAVEDIAAFAAGAPIRVLNPPDRPPTASREPARRAP